jgi:hypothetical protein
MTFDDHMDDAYLIGMAALVFADVILSFLSHLMAVLFAVAWVDYPRPEGE